MNLALVFGLSLTLCAVLSYAVLIIARELGWGIDATRGVPRVGGLAILLSAILVSALALDPPLSAVIALAAGSVVAAVGLLDDLGFGRGPLPKLAVSLAVAAAAVALTDVYVSHIDTPIISQLFEYPPFAIGVSVLALAGMCHGVNLIDGLHGLALSFAIIAFGALTIIAQSVGEPHIAGIALCLAGACLGLMAFNFPGGAIFMGDVGSYFLGFILAWLAIYLCHRHAQVSPWAMVCIFAYPIVDVGYAAARRIVAGQNPMRGDREHLHHRLMRLTGQLRKNNPQGSIAVTTTSCSAMALAPATFAALNFAEPQLLMALAASTVITLVAINWTASLA